MWPIKKRPMIKRYLTLIFVSLIIKTNGFGQIDNVSKDTIISRFQKGDMIIINNWALLGPTTFFDSTLIWKYSYKAKLLESDSAISRYGYFGGKIRIYELSIPSLDSISFGYFIDKQILKYLNPDKEIFYFINGAPCWNYSNALKLIVNKNIVKIQKLDITQASAIWGQKEGKNGALIIITDKKPKSIIIFK